MSGLPETTDDIAPQIDRLPSTNEAYIINPYHQIETLTPIQALDCINLLSGMLLADGRNRSKTKYSGNIRTP
jgi:hypothetical protein